jgi:hypothetical protein
VGVVGGGTGGFGVSGYRNDTNTNGGTSDSVGGQMGRGGGNTRNKASF